MDATSKLTWLHMHATSSRWQIIAYSWAEGLDQGPLLSPRVHSCLFSPSNKSLVDMSGSVFMYLAAAGQQEKWLQSWLLRLFPFRPPSCDDVILITYSGTERRCVRISHGSHFISFYYQGSHSPQWWLGERPERFLTLSDDVGDTWTQTHAQWINGLFEEQSICTPYRPPCWPFIWFKLVICSLLFSENIRKDSTWTEIIWNDGKIQQNQCSCLKHTSNNDSSFHINLVPGWAERPVLLLAKVMDRNSRRMSALRTTHSNVLIKAKAGLKSNRFSQAVRLSKCFILGPKSPKFPTMFCSACTFRFKKTKKNKFVLRFQLQCLLSFQQRFFSVMVLCSSCVAPGTGTEALFDDIAPVCVYFLLVSSSVLCFAAKINNTQHANDVWGQSTKKKEQLLWWLRKGLNKGRDMGGCWMSGTTRAPWCSRLSRFTGCQATSEHPEIQTIIHDILFVAGVIDGLSGTGQLSGYSRLNTFTVLALEVGISESLSRAYKCRGSGPLSVAGRRRWQRSDGIFPSVIWRLYPSSERSRQCASGLVKSLAEGTPLRSRWSLSHFIHIPDCWTLRFGFVVSEQDSPHLNCQNANPPPSTFPLG